MMCVCSHQPCAIIIRGRVTYLFYVGPWCDELCLGSFFGDVYCCEVGIYGVFCKSVFE